MHEMSLLMKSMLIINDAVCMCERETQQQRKRKRKDNEKKEKKKTGLRE